MTTQVWIGRLTSLVRKRAARYSIAARGRRKRSAVAEFLEERRLLAYLFVDFGDNFTGGTLTTTEGGLRDISGNPTNPVLGISLGDTSGFNAGTQLDIVAQTFTADARARMMAVVERDYAPLDINVVELTSTTQTTADGRNVRGAASMTDVINTLGAGDGTSHDAYIFVATFIADPGGANAKTYGPGGGGLSPGGTVLGYQTNLSSAQANYDEVAAVYSGGGFSFNTLNNIAHEAGHVFGLQHSLTNTTGTADTNLFPTAELMSYLNTNSTTSSMFTRYPMPRGDGNSPGYNGQATFSAAARTITLPSGSTAGFTAGLSITVSGTASNDGTYVIQAVTATTITLTAAATLTDETGNAGIVSLNLVNYNDLSARDGQNSNYDQLRLDPNIGPNPLYDFVSGTGAFDVIRLTRSGSSINVSVSAFGDAAHTDPIPVPSVGGTTYSYSLPVSAGKSILIYTGGSDDQVFIDGDLSMSVILDGMLGADSLIVNALNAANVVYTPNPTAPPGVDIQGGVNVASYGGTITVGGTVIAFNDFRPNSSVTIQNAGSVSYTTGSVGDDNLIVSNTAGGTPQLTGTVDNGVAVVPLDLTGVGRLAVTTGLGNDTLTVDSTNGLVTLANSILYNGGLGANSLRLVQTGGPTQTSDTYTVNSIPGMGNSVITGPSGTQSVFFQNLAPVFDNVPAPLTVVGTNANNVINYSQGATPGEGLATVDDAEPIDFTNKTSLTLQGLGGDDTITINNPFTPTGLTAINADGGSGNNTLVVNAQGAAVTSAVATATTVSIAGQLPVGYSNIQQIHIINSTDALTSTPTPVKAVEGAQAQDVVIGSFAFSDTVPPTLFANPTDFTASITWGDGTTTAGTIVSLGTAGFEVRGTHTYATFGTYPVSATITDKGSSRTFTPTGGTAPVTITSTAGSTTTIATTATVADAPLASQGAAVSGVEGLPLSTTPQGVVVATFTDLAPGGVPADYTATIAWGDGTTTAATQIVATGSPNGVTFLVYGNHTYAEEGEYSLSVTIKDTGGSQTTATSLVHVADAPLTAGPAVPINTIESPIYPVPVFGAPIFNGLVGTFSDANVNAPASDFRATIDWGDGTAPTFGTITKGATPGTFNVFGGHTYADSKVNGGAGHFTVLVRIDDEGGSEVTLSNTATVVDNPIVVTGALDTASDSGLSSTDAITNVNHPVFKGTSEPRSVVTVFATPLTGGLTRPIGQATAGSDGNWQVTSSPLADGQYVITASAVDQFGHTHSGLVTLLPNAAQGALIIDTVGPKVTDVFFDRLNGQIDVVYQDERSGMNASTLVDSSNYSLTKPHTFPATYLVTELTPSSSSDPTAPVTVPVTLNSGKSLRGGFYTFTIRSFGPGNREGVRDVAGNALDGEFYGKFPSGNGERGGDFVAMLDAVHRRIFAPQTVVGTASPANDGQGGAPVGAVHSGVFTLVHPRRTGAMQPFAFAAGRLRLGHRVNAPLRLAGLHPAGPLRAHRHH